MWFPDGRVQPMTRSKLQISLTDGQPKEINGDVELITGELSPDGKTVYMSANRDPQTTTLPAQGVAVIDVGTGTRRGFLQVPGAFALPALSPDGKTIAIMTRTAGNNQLSRIMLISIDGTGLRELVSGQMPDRNSLAWTRDGRSILFPQSDPSGSVRVMSIPQEGGTPVFTGLSAPGLTTFNLSTDGSRIAYSATSSNWEVWALENVWARLKAAR
jgi:Tol biopolymer transport system component